MASIVRGAMLACVGLALIAACSGDEPVAVELGLGCTIDSDCQAPLACVFSRCHAQCSASRDCPSDERCVLGRGETHVCQLPDERDCAYNSDCPAGQLCSVDEQCRDECLVDRDCVSEQRCVSHTCADSDELVDGGLASDAGTEGTPCSYDSECPAGQHCRKGKCLFECVTNSDCAFGFGCVDRRCEPLEPNFECVPGEQPHCTCADGAIGIKVCGPNATFGPCEFCTQPDGGAGVGGGGVGGGGVGAGGAGAGGGTTSTTGGAGAGASSSASSSSASAGGSTSMSASSSSSGGTGGSISVAASSSASSTTGSGGASASSSSSQSVSGSGGASASSSSSGTVFDAGVTEAGVLTAAPSASTMLVRTPEYLSARALRGVTAARLALDASGQIVVAGTLAEAVDGALWPNAAPPRFPWATADAADVFWTSLDGGGDLVRPVVVRARGRQQIVGVAANDTGHVALLGTYSGAIAFDPALGRLRGTGSFLLLMDPDGAPSWQRIIAGDASRVALADDRILVTGTLSRTDRARGAFVSSFDLTGTRRWLRALECTGRMSAEGLAAAPDGTAVVVGSFDGRLQIGGSVLDSPTRVAFVAAFDRDGRVVHAAVLGAMESTASDVAFHPDGGVVIVGSAAGGLAVDCGATRGRGELDAFVMRLDGRGRCIWARSFGGSAVDVAAAVAVDSFGEITVGGSFGAAATLGDATHVSAGALDAFLVKLDARGNAIRSRSFGNGADQFVQHIVIDRADDVVVSIGSTGGEVDFGGGPIAGDAYVLNFAP